jgi:CBS domain-containing protein
MVIENKVLNAAEVMTSDVFTLPSSLSLGGAAWALMHRGVSGAPVRDSEGNLVGVVSEGDLLEARGPLPQAISRALALGGGSDGDAEGEILAEDFDVAADDRSIEEIMTPVLVAVGPNDPIEEVVALMVAHAVRRVLVLDDDGRLAGIVTPVDVLRALAEGRLDTTRELHWLADRFAPAP